MEVCDTELSFGNYLMKQWFLSPGTVDTGAQISFVVGAFLCTVGYWAISLTSAPYPLDTHIHTPAVATWSVSKHYRCCQGPLGEQNHPWLKTGSLRMPGATTVSQTKHQCLFIKTASWFSFVSFFWVGVLIKVVKSTLHKINTRRFCF